MAYRIDEDLEFLKNCKDEDLKDLFELLTSNLAFTSTIKLSSEYLEYGKFYSKYWRRIAEELQLFGGNTIANLTRRGRGVLYREIATDVAKYFKIKINENDSIEEIENYIMVGLLEEADEEQRKKILEEFSSEEIKELSTRYNIPWKSGSIITIKQILKAGGFASYKMTVIIANLFWKKMFGRGLALATNRMLTKTLASIISGPIALVFDTWFILDLASPATRITTSAIAIISLLRKKEKIKLIEFKGGENNEF